MNSITSPTILGVEVIYSDPTVEQWGLKNVMLAQLTPANPFPLHDRFSPWHALGPSSNYPAYSEKMRKYSYLRFLSLACRLAPGDEDIAGAEAQWQESFSIGKRRDGGCEFVNGVKLNLLPGREGVKDGLTEVCIGVESPDKLRGILARAKTRGLVGESDLVDMVGIRWKFKLVEKLREHLPSSKL
ncbi:hypothetical protein M7I_5191 [Glarea lozoyensis 74030]|uniref:Uncharacterized protein n=1 Tax=Glarea lozoyensis (strain ATCC 74030 / MF5533) TaxID=1104152 RepID=H0ER74_GLAL7|nr:hypothetical protein M7I_5191 [Glarea lozoyensis 74030]